MQSATANPRAPASLPQLTQSRSGRQSHRFCTRLLPCSGSYPIKIGRTSCQKRYPKRCHTNNAYAMHKFLLMALAESSSQLFFDSLTRAPNALNSEIEVFRQTVASSTYPFHCQYQNRTGRKLSLRPAKYSTSLLTFAESDSAPISACSPAPEERLLLPRYLRTANCRSQTGPRACEHVCRVWSGIGEPRARPQNHR